MSDPERTKIVARWEGTVRGRDRHYPTREPGGFGALFSTPNWVKTVTVSIGLREEINLKTARVYTVVESIDWAAQVDDLYYENRDGSRVPAGVGGVHSVRFTEEELTRGPGTAGSERLRSLERYVDEARERVRDAEKQKTAATQKALLATKPEEDVTGAAELEAALLALRRTLAGDGVRDENSERAFQAFHDALTPVMNEFHAEIYRISGGSDALIERITAVFANPTATEADKSAASAASDEFRKTMDDAVAGQQAVYNWYYARYELITADSELAQARGDLRNHQRRLVEARAERVLAATAAAGIRVDRDTGRRMAFVEYALGETNQLDFPVDIVPLTLANARSMDVRADASAEYEPTVFTGAVPVLGWGFKGEAETSTAGAVVKFSESEASGEPGLIGGGGSAIEVVFTRKPEPMRYEASVTTVSEIPPNSLPFFNQIGLWVGEGWAGRWSPDWVDQYGNYTEANPLDAAFSDRQQFRFMHVLAAFVETPDGATITHGDFLPMGPNGEQTIAGKSVIVAGAREFKPLASSMKMTVDGVEVMIFEQAYGAQAIPADLSTTIDGPWFPPIWTALRIGISADGRRVKEMFDYSYFPQHFIFDEGVFRTSTIEDPVAWGHHGWWELEEGPSYFMFDPGGAEAWWREKSDTVVDFNKGAIKGNPWKISPAITRPIGFGDGSPAVHK